MPRAWNEQVQDYPKLDRRPYRVLIEAVSRHKAERCIGLQLVHLDSEQAGRRHNVRIPLPLRPGGIGAELARALRTELRVGDRVSPKEWQVRSLRVTFTQGQDEVEHFLPDIAEE